MLKFTKINTEIELNFTNVAIVLGTLSVLTFLLMLFLNQFAPEYMKIFR